MFSMALPESVPASHILFCNGQKVSFEMAYIDISILPSWWVLPPTSYASKRILEVQILYSRKLLRNVIWSKTRPKIERKLRKGCLCYVSS